MTNADEAPPLEKHGTWIALLAMLAIFAYASFISSTTSLFDRDEPRFAQASVEMLQSGNWLYPTFDNELRPDKPILVYWLMAQSIRVFGATDWAARFWSPVCLALGCLVVFFVGRKLFDTRSGLLAMAFVALSPLALMEGTIATTDALLFLCLTTAMASFVYATLDGARALHYALFTLAVVGALLAKGPVGAVIPLLSILTTWWFLRSERTFKRKQVLTFSAALIVAIVLALLWWIPADRATGGEYGARGIGDHVMGRMATPLEGHGGGFLVSLPFYFPVVALGFLVGLMFLPGAISALVGCRIGNARSRGLIIAWTLPCFVLMTLVSTKLPNYILPIWPGLALMCAAVVDAAERSALNDLDRSWLSSGTWIYMVAALIFAAAPVVGAVKIEIDGLLNPAIVLAFVVVVTTFVATHMHRRNQPRRAAHVVLAGFAIAWIVGAVLIAPVVEKVKVAPVLAAAIRAQVPVTVPVARWKFVEPSLDFCLGRPPIRDFDDEASLRAWAADTAPAVLVLPREVLNALRDVLPEARYTEIAAAQGFNISKGEKIELVALGRQLPLPTPR